MNKWIKRFGLGMVWTLPLAYAAADTQITQGTGTVIANFVCQTTKICAAAVLIDSTGVEKATASNALRTDPTGTTTQPVSGNLGSSQLGTWTVQPGNTANTTPWLTSLQAGGHLANITTGGLLQVDASGTTVPVSGTVNGVQSGAWTVQPGNTANITPWLMSISQGGHTATVNGSNQLVVNCASGCSSTGSAFTDEAAFTQGTTQIDPIGGIYTSSPASLTSGQAGVVRLTSDRFMLHTAAAAPGFGCTGGHFLSAATTNATAVKSGLATLCELTVVNTTSTIVDLRLYDVAGAPTCSSSTGVIANYPVQPNTIGAGIAVQLGPYGKAFASGIGICLTGGNADNDNTAAVVGVNVNYAYK